MTASSACPCGLGASFDQCCGPIVAGDTTARTAEALMRSRYSAYVRCDSAHLLRTWHPDHRPASLSFEVGKEWLGLDVVDTVAGGLLDATGVVEFTAHFRGGSQHERSRFGRVNGMWVYIDGLVE